MKKHVNESEKYRYRKDDERFDKHDVEPHQPLRKALSYRDRFKLPSLVDKSLIEKRLVDFTFNNWSNKQRSTPALVCQTVHRLLTAHFRDAALLRVDHVSCQYVQLRLLGPKRYWYRKIRRVESDQNDCNAYIYSVRCRPSTLKYLLCNAAWMTLPRLNDDDVELRHIGRFDCLEKSIEACDEAFSARDEANPFVQWPTYDLRDAAFIRELPEQLCSYYKVTVISDAFEQFSQQERVQVILSVLLTADTDCAASFPSGKSLPIACRHISYSGSCVASLPIWRFLQFHFLIHAKTVRQNDCGKKVKGRKKTTRSERSSDVDACVSSEKVSRLCTFNQRRMRRSRETNCTRDLLAISDQTSVKNAGDKIRVVQRPLVVAARQLQRVYRKNTQSRMLRALIKQLWAAISIQRLYRGFHCRKKLKIHTKVVECASVLIQSVYRSFQLRRHNDRVRTLSLNAARHIESVYRRYRVRWHWNNIHRLVHDTLVLQRAIRCFLARQHAHRLRIAAYNRNVLFPVVILFQSICRGYIDRREAEKIKLWRYQGTVQFDAAILLQKHIRSFLSRQIVQKGRNHYFSAGKIQTVWRAFQRRRCVARQRKSRDLHKHASTIGAAVRGALARRYCVVKKRQKYVQEVEVPSAIELQRIFRGFLQRKQFESLKERNYAAVILQHAWKAVQMRRKDAQAAQNTVIKCQNDAVYIIQTEFRRYCARKQYFSMQIKRYGARGKAILMLQNMWRMYRTRQRMQQLCVSALELRTTQLLEGLKNRRQQIRIDIRNRQVDWIRMRERGGRLKQRRKELEESQKKCERRLSTFANGGSEGGITKWDQVLSKEQRRIEASIQQSLEDIASHSIEIRACERKIELVWREVQSIELEWKQCTLNETAEIERHRKMRSIQERVMRRKEWVEAVRTERVRWKPRHVRRSHLGAPQACEITPKHIAKPSATVITFEIEALIRRMEAIKTDTFEIIFHKDTTQTQLF